MAGMNSLGEHIENCEICKTAQSHMTSIAVQMQREFTGAAPPPQQLCGDCGFNCFGTIFMVHDSLWKRISRGQDPLILCVLCSEKRLGRRFAASDFQDIPINAPWIYAVGRYGG